MTETSDVLSRIKRGLAGYISYLAACEMNKAFSEYVLYEPILRILTARNYEVECEYECPNIEQPQGRGDKKRLDFFAYKSDSEFALEVKWVKTKNSNFSKDVEKLRAFLNHKPHSRALLCIFGRKSDIGTLKLNIGNHSERGSAMYADFKRTKYGCRIFQLRP